MAEVFPCDGCGVHFGHEWHLLRHLNTMKHMEMKDIQDNAEEMRLEESDAAMDESVSVPDSSDPKSNTAIDSDSDITAVNQSSRNSILWMSPRVKNLVWKRIHLI